MSVSLVEKLLKGFSALDRYVALEGLGVLFIGVLTAKVTHSFYHFNKNKNSDLKPNFFQDHRYIMWLPLMPSYIFAIGTALHLAMSHNRTAAALF